jgi:hypothetical protein
MRSRTAAALLAVALLTGCGVFTDPGADGAGTAARPRPVTTPGPELYSSMVERMLSEGTATFVFSGIGGGRTVSGQGAMRFGDGEFDADVALTMPDTGEVRAVLLASESYVALPAAKGLPRGKPWLKVPETPRSELGKAMGPVVEQMRDSFDPAQGLGLLDAARKVQETGPATVEGVPTTQYHAVVDLRRATRLADDAAREQYQSMLDAGVRTLELDIWVDTSGLPRRYSTDIPTTAGLFSITGIYRGWGEKVRIERPAKKQVYDANELTG